MNAQLNYAWEDNGWFLEIISRTGEITMRSQSFDSLAHCEDAYSILIANLCLPSHYHPSCKPDGPWSFNLCNQQEEILCCGQEFWSIASRDHAMMTMKAEGIDLFTESLDRWKKSKY